MKTEMIYWGVICRGCSEPVAFGAPYHHQFDVESSYARPGAIRCGNGHIYIYFPRDFKFFCSAEEIADSVMRANRDAHREINPLAEPRSEDWSGTRWTPESKRAIGRHEGDVLKLSRQAKKSEVSDAVG
jgi:hypothetical protein